MAGLRRLGPYLRLALLATILLVAVMVALMVRNVPVAQYVANLLDAVRGTAWAPVLFVLAYAVATAFALPGSLLTLAGGAVFGFWWGSLLNTLGANIGANAAFRLARALGREGIERLAGNRLKGLDKATADHGFMGLFVLRLIPAVPFNALNFGSGLTAMRWRHYAAATVLGILPGTLVYTFFADALMLGSTEARSASIRLWAAGGLLIALSLVPLIARRLGFKLPSRSSREVL